MKVRAPFALALALLTGCAHGSGSHAAQTPNPISTLLIESKGVTMPLQLAVHTLAFRPFIPGSQIVQVAVIPPLNVDRQKDHGLAIEYAAGGSALLLSQWPRASFRVAAEGDGGVAGRPCSPAAYDADGLIWTTRNGLVMTLQPDGTVPASHLASEARRLLEAGAC